MGQPRPKRVGRGTLCVDRSEIFLSCTVSAMSHPEQTSVRASTSTTIRSPHSETSLSEKRSIGALTWTIHCLNPKSLTLVALPPLLLAAEAVALVALFLLELGAEVLARSQSVYFLEACLQSSSTPRHNLIPLYGRQQWSEQQPSIPKPNTGPDNDNVGEGCKAQCLKASHH